MKKSLLALAAVASLSTAAFAQDADPSGQFATQVDSNRSRAEVQAEAVAAVARGELRPSNANPSSRVQPAMNTTTTRAQVVAAFLADRAEVAAFTGEDSGSTYLAKAARTAPAREYLATITK